MCAVGRPPPYFGTKVFALRGLGPEVQGRYPIRAQVPGPRRRYSSSILVIDKRNYAKTGQVFGRAASGFRCGRLRGGAVECDVGEGGGFEVVGVVGADADADVDGVVQDDSGGGRGGFGAGADVEGELVAFALVRRWVMLCSGAVESSVLPAVVARYWRVMWPSLWMAASGLRLWRKS